MQWDIIVIIKNAINDKFLLFLKVRALHVGFSGLQTGPVIPVNQNGQSGLVLSNTRKFQSAEGQSKPVNLLEKIQTDRIIFLFFIISDFNLMVETIFDHNKRKRK